MLPIVVMLWRLYIARKRKILLTIFELFFPILIFVGYLLIKVKFTGGSLKADPDAYPVAAAPLRVCYTPETNLTKTLMDEAGRRLFLHRLDHPPGEVEEGFAPVSDRQSMKKFSERMEVGDAIVEFQNLNGSEFPKKLYYTIRMKSGLRPQNLVKIVIANGEAINQFDTIYEPFVRLQWALDISFLQLRSGTNINPTLTLDAVEKKDSTGTYVPLINLYANLECQLVFHTTKIAIFVPLLFFIMRLADEKNSGIEELLKLSSMSTTTLYGLHYINMIPGVLVYSIGGSMCFKMGEKPVIPFTSSSMIALVFFLQMWSLIACGAFATSLVVPKRPFPFALAAYAVTVMLIPAVINLMIKYIGHPLKFIFFLVPMQPAKWIFEGIGLFELVEEAAQFGRLPASVTESLLKMAGGKPFLNIGWSCVVMALQIVLYFQLGLCMTRIMPGPYGETQDASIFSFLKKKTPVVVESVKPPEPDPRYFEELPRNLPVGIRIQQVTKVFPRHVALTNLTLDVLKGEITLLLGHNGAGKTTILNIISGMYNPTSGKVEINGINVAESHSEAYRLVGLCPQHNLFFTNLTVMEHVMVFSLLKGFTIAKARNSAGVIMKQLGLESKVDNFPSTLSGGMKRRVQLACALAGDSSVLILDEPTSGLDVETRRGLWDLLLSLRGDRTVLLTTHFMEEADALGDRVAALHRGHLKCHATPMFLKNAVGGGYRLSITMKEGNDDKAITDLIRNSVPSASVCDKSHKLVTYNLPSTDSAKFPKLFAELDEKKESLGIVSIGVGKSTLDEVFIRLCSDVVTRFEEVKFEAEPKFKKLTGISLYFRMCIVLMQRQLRFVQINIFSYLFVHVLFPFAMAFAGGWVVNQNIIEALTGGSAADAKSSMKSDPIHMLRGNLPTYSVLSGSNEILPKLRYKYVDSNQLITPDADLILRSDKNDYIINVELNDTHAKAKYGASARHAAPVAVNLLSNLLARRWLDETGSSISVLNQPIDDDSEMYADAKTIPEKCAFALMFFGIIMAVQCVEISNFAITLASKELTTGTRHIHQMCGCPLTLYWAITICFHMTAVLCFGIVPDIIALFIFEKDNILTQPEFLLSFSLIGFLGVLAFTELYFCASVIYSESVASLLLNGFMMVGICCAVTQYFMRTGLILEVSQFFCPIHNLILGVLRCGITANLNAKCKILRAKCPNLYSNDLAFDDERCCESSGIYESYFRMDDKGAGKELLFLCFQTCFYMWLLLMADSGVFANLREKWRRCKVNGKSRFIDSLVEAERQHVATEIRKPRKAVEDALLCYDVHKKYSSCCTHFMAVNGLNISVKRRECYGLLGINGAGKSTTFKMIIAETSPTHGHLVSNGYYINEKIAYMQTFSYCPQFFGLDDFLTGEQNLILVLTLRGLSAEDAKAQAASWLEEIGLTQYAQQCVSGYSGGCARRLAAVAALCQHSHIALLDEPTTGVDTAARRRVHAAVLRAKQTKSVVIASHSMDEIEALCDRICIMSAGEVAALGSAAELRERHATGFSAVFKLSAPSAVMVADKGTMAPEKDGERKAVKAAQAGKSDQEDKSPPLLEHPQKRAFLEQMRATFDCRVIDDHRTMCHIHINNLMPYSKLFGIIEDIKKNYSDLIEDYVVSETTLEEVFIGIAKEGQEYVESQKKAKARAK